MSIINRLQNENSQSWSSKLADKFWDSYLVIMGVMVLMIGLLPVTLVALQY
jgi:hypothetical protein